MTIGEGILSSTILILIAAAIYILSIKGKWKLFGKILAVILILGAIIGGIVWAYIIYQDRPIVVNELWGVRLGMTPLEVKLAKGEPTDTDDLGFDEDGEYRIDWNYVEENGDSSRAVMFTGDSSQTLDVGIICETDSRSDGVLGFGMSSREEDVVKKLGQPTNISIRDDGLAKLISYKQWNVTYGIHQGKVEVWCISSKGKVSFKTEYSDEQNLKGSDN